MNQEKNKIKKRPGKVQILKLYHYRIHFSALLRFRERPASRTRLDSNQLRIESSKGIAQKIQKGSIHLEKVFDVTKTLDATS